ncbi:unnamed protein product [Durusdinium trenchii]|uniref:C3H1-type domain-containing protein n=1 Tax=Durusdinium trenchii TaxID=1381693 RepID=A0ABP0QSY8_9DINO
MASIGGEGSGPGGHRLHLAHVMGLCDPCVFHQSVRGCAKGSQCGFCHLPHQHDPDGVRPKKTRRQRIKNEVLELLVSKGPEDLHAALQEDARKHPYVRRVIVGQLNNASFLRSVGTEKVVFAL